MDKILKIKKINKLTMPVEKFKTFESFFTALKKQLSFIIKNSVELYEKLEYVNNKFHPTPFFKMCNE